MYSNLSNFSEGVDSTFVIIFSIIAIFLVGLTCTLIYFLIRYREKKNPVPTQIKGNVWLEIIWVIIPIVLVMGMFYYGWMAWIPMLSKAPADAIEIKTTAQMWSWRFEYENGKKTDSLIIPVGRPVVLKMISPDVIHSLYIPAFRIKRDIVPGRIVEMWFEANKEGSYDLFCAEYCGLQHSFMTTSVNVLSQDKYDNWYIDTTEIIQIMVTPGAAGLKLIKDNGCIACHSLDGSKLVGPSYKNIFGHEVEVSTNGINRALLVDAEYIKNSIYNPDDDIVKGFRKGLMRSYKNELTDKDIEQITIYIKTLSDKKE
ncbi:MAG: cytochrome c oxidase subunit II [Bacteroidetes bacterium GWA2_31_9b]|nr:MAG: cytochrome c oxidase subunit II [Bacteroidetes bacterium GWA2_31_9b]